MAKTTKKVKKEINRNILMAVAITSVLINMFFLIGVVTYTSTSKFDEALLSRSLERYCDDYSDVVAASGNFAEAKTSFEVNCRTGEFAPYYDEALQDYLRDLGY